MSDPGGIGFFQKGSNDKYALVLIDDSGCGSNDALEAGMPLSVYQTLIVKVGGSYTPPNQGACDPYPTPAVNETTTTTITPGSQCTARLLGEVADQTTQAPTAGVTFTRAACDNFWAIAISPTYVGFFQATDAEGQWGLTRLGAYSDIGCLATTVGIDPQTFNVLSERLGLPAALQTPGAC